MSDLAIAPLADAPVKSATEQVFDALYEAVISLQLTPGTKVSEIEVAKQLGVSRQPVRDAFFRLSNLGFLAIRPQRATLITRISEKAVLDAMFVRTALELECLRAASVRLTPEYSARLHANLDKQTAELDGPDHAEFHALDDAFHALLCEIAGQPQVWRLIQEQKAHMDRVRYLTLSHMRKAEVLADHIAIVDALEAGDSAMVDARLRMHLGDIRTALVGIRKDNPDYFEIDG